jgi:hypothetical protein
VRPAINKAGTVADSRLTDRSVANIVKAYAARAQQLFRSLAAVGFPDIRGGQWRFNFQDD